MESKRQASERKRHNMKWKQFVCKKVAVVYYDDSHEEDGDDVDDADAHDVGDIYLQGNESLNESCWS